MGHDEPARLFKNPLKWLVRWLCATNHKDIGYLYLWMSLIMFFVAGFMALLIRAELFQPGSRIVDPNFYNELITLHGLIMIFGVVMPAFTGLANIQVPMMIGAPDMAFPRMNNWSFWLTPFALVMLISTLFMSGSAPNFGWTFYAPLSTTYGPESTDFMIFSIHMLGLSSIMASINILVTIFNMRTKGLTMMKLPIFCWTWIITAFLILAIMPVLAGVVTMLLTDRHFGTSFFDAAGGGDPILFQHLFWFFGHPEVYVLILPSFGVISEVLPTFSRKPLFGRHMMVYATISIAFLSFIVWVHHMFTTGVPLAAELFFMYSTMLIAVPTGVKVFNWVATIWKGALSFETPMLFALGFLFMFTFGGLSGLMLSIAPADHQYHDTYFVVAHFHYVLVSGAIYSLFAGIYYWMPKWTGRMYSSFLSKAHFWLTTIGLNLTFFPMHFLGLAGMPRRIPDYALQFANFNAMATVGAFIFGFTQLIFLYIVIRNCFGGKKATDRVWEYAHGMEFQCLPSPAPYHSFEEPVEFEDRFLPEYDPYEAQK